MTFLGLNEGVNGSVTLCIRYSVLWSISCLYSFPFVVLIFSQLEMREMGY